MPGTLRENETQTPATAPRSVALIGPNESSRRIMVRGLVNSGATVREFLAYPATLGDLPGILDQNFHMVLIDVDTDESYALTLITAIASYRSSVVMAYAQRNPQDLILRCMQAGARDFFFVPAEQEPETVAASGAVEPPEPPTPPERAASVLAFPARPAPPESVAAASVATEPLPVLSAAPTPVTVPDPAPVALPDPAPVPSDQAPAVSAPPPVAAPQPEYDRPLFGQIGFEPPKRHPLRLILAGSATLLVASGLAFAFMPQLQPARTGLLSHFGVHTAAPAPATAPAASGNLSAKP